MEDAAPRPAAEQSRIFRVSVFKDESGYNTLDALRDVLAADVGHPVDELELTLVRDTRHLFELLQAIK